MIKSLNLLSVVSVDESVKQCTDFIVKNHLKNSETVDIADSFLRILANPIISLENVPNFNRSTVDGYALIASETFGASEALPSVLRLVGEIQMGVNSSLTVQKGECIKVMTGAMLPKNANAVVMIEYTENFGDNLLIYKAVSENENVIWCGEDAKVDDVLFNPFHQMRHGDIGFCAACGINKVDVFKKLKAVIISTGEEVIEVNKKAEIGQVHDVNMHVVKSMLQAHHFDIVETLLIQDDQNKLQQTCLDYIDKVDLIIISGGSSQGEKDYTAEVINNCGEPGVFVHGVAIKPGKPTILGASGKTLMIGLPGQPVSALTVLREVVLKAYDQAFQQKPLMLKAILTQNIIGAAGRETTIYVSLKYLTDKIEATPLYTKSGLISTLKNADAYVIIPRNLEGYPANSVVDCYLL